MISYCYFSFYIVISHHIYWFCQMEKQGDYKKEKAM